ncbi:hypothetical protein L3X38_040641 [Prunus dulcis]|uniref:Uncharacterized protein n=1 Tax=Prunus dulcis TaxID=3755 RepID=A0AAD4YUA9_PRUDU|nr:hypothetical protein L3X38_040641 [Prunus dulcis]
MAWIVSPWDRLRRSTILSALGSPLCPHDFVSGNSRATSQWVTHPGIALAPNALNFGVPTTPKPVDYIFLSPARGIDGYAFQADHSILQGHVFSG